MLHHASIGVACAQGHIRHHDMQIHAAIGLNLKNVRFLVSVHEANSLGDASKKKPGAGGSTPTFMVISSVQY